MDTLGGVGVLDKAVAILDCLTDGPLGLTELSRRTGIKKPTVHRLCAALAAHGVIRQDGELRTLGPKLHSWVHPESVTSRLLSVAGPALQRLRDATGESAQLYVAEGDRRRCIAALESQHGLRTIVDVGALLPLDAGSAGAVLRSTNGDARWIESAEEREAGVASVSAPVFSEGRVVAAISVSGPIDRMTRHPGALFGDAVVDAARSVSVA